MKKVNVSIVVIVLVCLCCVSCSPKVMTTVLKTYPALPDTAYVAVYEDSNNVPASAEPLGKVSVVDNMFSTRGSYQQVVSMATAKTRAVGGNGFLITQHIPPSAFGSSIHQISGTMLRINPLDAAVVSDGDTARRAQYAADIDRMADTPRKPNYVTYSDTSSYNRPALGNTVAVNIGYGTIIGSTAGLQGAEREAARKLFNGTNWDVRFILQSKRRMGGVGFIYSQYCSGLPGDKVINRNTYNSVIIRSFMVDWVFRGHFAPKWIFASYLGAGYMGFRQNLESIYDTNSRGSVWGATVGFHFGVGVDYRFSKHFGIGADLSVLNGKIMKLNYDNAVPNNPEMLKNNGNLNINISRLNITTGVRYYF